MNANNYEPLTPKDKYIFEQILAKLDRTFPDKEVLSCQEVCRYLGLSAPTVRSHIPRNDWNKYSKYSVAKYLAWERYN